MPLGPFVTTCPRCGRATQFAQVLPWLAVAAVAVVVVLGFAAFVWTRINDHAVDPSGPVHDSVLTLAPAPPRGMVAALDSAEAANGGARNAGQETTTRQAVRAANIPDTLGIEVNAHPPDPSALDGIQPAERRRSALDALLRRGLADSLRERSPRVVQVFVGRAFFRQPPQFRDPLMKALDLAWADAGGNRRAFELWWDTFRVGVYTRDTFRFGKWYYEFR
jgi:hypothetical protein